MKGVYQLSYSYTYKKPKLPPIIRLSVVILLIFGWLYYKKAELRRTNEAWVPVRAVVTRVIPPESEDGKILVHYSYRNYIDIPGSDYCTQNDIAEGDEIRVYYNRDDYTISVIEMPHLTLEAYAPFFFLPIAILAFLDNTNGRTVIVRRKRL